MGRKHIIETPEMCCSAVLFMVYVKIMVYSIFRSFIAGHYGYKYNEIEAEKDINFLAVCIPVISKEHQ